MLSTWIEIYRLFDTVLQGEPVPPQKCNRFMILVQELGFFLKKQLTASTDGQGTPATLTPTKNSIVAVEPSLSQINGPV